MSEPLFNEIESFRLLDDCFGSYRTFQVVNDSLIQFDFSKRADSIKLQFKVTFFSKCFSFR